VADVVAGHRRHVVRLVVDGEVVEALLAADVHGVDAFLDDHGQFVGVGRVVGAAGGDGVGQQGTVPVLVLEALAVNGGAAGGPAHQEPAGPGVGGGPRQVPHPLEPEHRV